MPLVSLPDNLPRPPPVLTRKQAAQYLSESGYLISVPLLAKLAVSGNGPRYRRWGRRVLYQPEDLLRWAEERSGRRLSSSTEHDAA